MSSLEEASAVPSSVPWGKSNRAGGLSRTGGDGRKFHSVLLRFFFSGNVQAMKGRGFPSTCGEDDAAPLLRAVGLVLVSFYSSGSVELSEKRVSGSGKKHSKCVTVFSFVFVYFFFFFVALVIGVRFAPRDSSFFLPFRVNCFRFPLVRS